MHLASCQQSQYCSCGLSKAHRPRPQRKHTRLGRLHRLQQPVQHITYRSVLRATAAAVAETHQGVRAIAAKL